MKRPKDDLFALIKLVYTNIPKPFLFVIIILLSIVIGVLDYFTGRPFEHMSDKEIIEDPNVNDLSAAIEVAKWLPKKYMEEYGSINCVNIQFQIYGRPFYLEDPDEMKKLEEAGGHSNPEKCPRVVGNAAKWTMEILLDKGAVTLG